MSHQVGDCFNIFWPFQNVRTLTALHLFISMYSLFAFVSPWRHKSKNGIHAMMELHQVTLLKKLPILDFQSEFSMPKFIRICLTLFSIKDNKGTFCTNDSFITFRQLSIWEILRKVVIFLKYHEKPHLTKEYNSKMQQR